MNDIASSSNRFRASPQMIVSMQVARSHPDAMLWRQAVFEVPGELDLVRLNAASRALATRHEILRTRLESVEGAEPVQVVDAEPTATEATIERSDAAVTPAVLARIAGASPPATEHALLMHVIQGKGQASIVLSGSSLLIDALSMDVLRSQLQAAYESAADTIASDPVQYADYAAWARQRAIAQGQLGAETEQALAIDMAGGSTPETHGRRIVTRLDGAALQACRDHATTSGADTLRAVALAAYGALLRKLGAGDQFAIAVYFDGRREDGLAQALGDFTEATALPLAMRADTTQDELRQDIAALLDRHEGLAGETAAPPFDALSRAAGFEFVDTRNVGTAASWSTTSRHMPARATRIHLCAIEMADALELHWWFSGRDGANEVAEAIAKAYVALLSCDSSKTFRDVGIDEASPSVAAGGTIPAKPAGLAARFATLATSHGDRPAVVDHGREFDFHALAALSARLAARLAAHGVGAGDRVALVLEHADAFVIGALAASHLGATWVPLEKGPGTARLRGILARLSPRIVLSDAALPEVESLVVDAAMLDSLASDEGIVPPVAPTDADRAAYIMYTSGSTGVPKGVVVSEAAFGNYLDWAGAFYPWNDVDASLVHTALHVDLTVTGLWVALLAGKTVHVVDSRTQFNDVAKRLTDGTVWFCKMTPTHLRALRSSAGAGNEARGTWVVGGEQLLGEDVAPWLAGGSLRVFNEYGPTEATVGCVVHEVGSSVAPGAVSIGTPVANTRIAIVDVDGQVLPRGLAGELLIAGAGLATGYLDDPELTSQRFRPSAADNANVGERMYATGDVAIMQADGSTSCIGRTDRQLKVRGHRIEPAEIESALLATGLVESAVALVTVHPSQGDVLAAYCVMKHGVAMHPAALRAALSENLSEYMLPNAYVQVTRIPHTAAGKRDVARLLADHPVRAISDAPFAPPRTLVEDTLASVWSVVLALQTVGIDDNYFALGGDSLKSLQITALADHRGVRFTLDQLHRHPTIRSLAQAIDVETSDIQVHFTQPFDLIDAEDKAKIDDDIEDAYPLNLLQEGMIYHREFAPKSAVYHAICSYRILAPFDLELMREAVETVVQRHPLLRTSFDLTRFSRPMQLVHAVYPRPMGYMDVSALTPQQQQVQIDVWMENEKKTGFELDEFPLIRYMLHKLGDDSFQFSYSFHHEIVDGWSDALMATQVVSQYMARVNGEAFDIPKPTSTFRDAIYLEQQALANEKTRDFWHGHMENVEVMRLPNLNRPKADKGDRTIVKFELPLSMAQSDRIKALARTMAVPLKTVLLAAHVKVMSVMGGTTDVMTYTVGNGRPENRDAHAVVGLFVNSLAFRQKLPGGSWSELIHDALRTELDVLAHRRFPMAELKRQHGSEPLAETLFFFNHYHVTDVLSQWGNFSLDGLKVYAESTFPYCVNAYIEPFTGKLRVRVEYDKLQYSAEAMDLLNHCFVAVLDAMSVDPSTRYDTDDFLDGPVRERIRALCTGEKLPEVTDTSVLDLFARHVAERPDHAALVCGERSSSYAELDAASDRIAAALVRRGVKTGDIVAVAMERSAESIEAMLGVLKSGAAYVPLDLASPVERTRHVLSYTHAKLLLTRAADAVALDAVSADTLTVEDALAEPVSHIATRRVAGPAYVIYTSGTTGQPKGVVIDHASLLASTRARFAYYGYSPASFLLLSSHAFDSSVAGIYWTLCGGGTLVLPPSAQLDVAGLPALIDRHGVTELLCIPSFYGVLLDELAGAGATGLRSAIVAGEACPRDIRDKHDLVLPGTMLFNEYGPTEATVWATVQRCDDIEFDPGTRGAVLPIGGPVAGAVTYVLDVNMNMVPFGVAGELYIGGAGLAIGYLDNPMLTAARFVPDPHARTPGERLYRTGDVVRLDDNGQIEFLSRRDRMVKIQGFRVELLEIEQMLERHPAVARCLVHAFRPDGQPTQLAAYVVPAEGTALDPSELQAFIKRFLPKYMVPAHFVSLEALPMRRDGAFDYAALPQPRSEEAEIAPPTTPTEAALVGIWRDVLGRENVGIHADFHALGGESLGALRIASRIGKAFDVRVPVGSLMAEYSNIASLGAHVDALRRQERRTQDTEDEGVI